MNNIKFSDHLILICQISIILIINSSCSSTGGSGPQPINELINPTQTIVDQRYEFQLFENKMQSPWGDVTYSYGTSAFRSSDEFPSNEKYKIEDYGFLQVTSKGSHPGDSSNQDEITTSGPWINNGQWFEANLNGDEFSDLIYVGNSIGTREYVPEDLMITFLNDGSGHFQISPEIFLNNTFPCVHGGTNWLNTDTNDPKKECGNQQDYSNGKIVADFNGDGISDYYDTSILYLSNNGKLENKSLSNLPSLFFEEGHGQIFAHDASHGDLDNDGDLDIFVPIFDNTKLGYLFGGEIDECSGCTQNIPFTALINDGSGNFKANHNFPEFEWLTVDYDNHGANIDKLWPTTAVIADFNNDGYGDIAFGWFNPRISALYGFSENSAGAVYLNNGSNDWNQLGFIELPANFFGSNGNANDMEAFDFDDDGFVDIVMASTIHEPYYESRVIQFFRNMNGENFEDVTNEKYPDYSIYANGNPFSSYWIGQGKIRIVDYDHDGDLDIIDSNTRTYVLLNEDNTYRFYDDFVDEDEDRILWPVEIDGKYHYDFIGSNVKCSGDSCTTNFFQVLDPLNEDLLKNFLSKGNIYSNSILTSVAQYNHVRRVSRNSRFIYKDTRESFLLGYNSILNDKIKLFTGSSEGKLHGNFIGISKNIFSVRTGLIFSDNYSKNISNVDFLGSSFARLEFKTSSVFVEKSTVLKNLILNFGIAHEKIFVDSFKDIGSFQNIDFKKLNLKSNSYFIDLDYPFTLLGFTGNIGISSSKRNFTSALYFESINNLMFPLKPKMNYFDGELSLNRGPFFLSIKHLEDRPPIINVGFNINIR